MKFLDLKFYTAFLLNMKFIVFAAFLVIRTLAEFDPRNHKNWKLLKHDICGVVSSLKIIGGSEAPMNSYPWMARIGQIKKGSQDFRCGGVIANSKTILTAAHCVYHLGRDYKIAVIRLGEHNTETDPDCEAGYCADSVIDIEPSEILVHGKYNNPPHKNDIAIIRLKEEIKFSAFVKPICFVSGDLYKKSYIGSVVEVAGWGVYNMSTFESSKKLQFVELSVVKNYECKKILPAYINIGPTQLCVGGTDGTDSCNGDSGGPLMKIDDGPNGPRYYFLGIVSIGSKKCGTNNMPGVYTNVPAYMEWILNNLEKTTSDSIKVL